MKDKINAEFRRHYNRDMKFFLDDLKSKWDQSEKILKKRRIKEKYKNSQKIKPKTENEVPEDVKDTEEQKKMAD